MLTKDAIAEEIAKELNIHKHEITEMRRTKEANLGRRLFIFFGFYHGGLSNKVMASFLKMSPFNMTVPRKRIEIAILRNEFFKRRSIREIVRNIHIALADYLVGEITTCRDYFDQKPNRKYPKSYFEKFTGGGNR